MQLDFVHHGDCLAFMKTLPDCCIDAVVTDPPYGLSFMGKAWDYDVPGVEVWREVLRVLKPGGHLLSFFGTRTYHRGVVRIEDAGFDIRDFIAWVYGSGFPKSLDVSKAIDKQAGEERERNIVPHKRSTLHGGRPWMDDENYRLQNNIAITPEAKRWHGWGTALKPALEPIVLARKPLCSTVADNVLAHGTGAINIDGCRVGMEQMPETKSDGTFKSANNSMSGFNTGRFNTGRFPANLVHDGSAEVVELFPVECGGSAARFFYCAKAQAEDREAGIREAGIREAQAGGLKGRHDGSLGSITMRGNHHPTVKPVDLMRWLVRLVTPPDGIVLDPFGGSGSTAKAAILEGQHFILCEREAEYCEIARARIADAFRTRAATDHGARFDAQGREVARQMKLNIA